MNIRQKLDLHYKAFDKTKISPDPLQFLHFYIDERDIEVIGFIASIFAYGNVKQIINSLEKIRTITKDEPFNYVINFSKKDYKNFNKLKHRFYTEADIINLFLVMSRVYKTHGSLKNLFLHYYDPKEQNFKNAISKFSNHIAKICTSLKLTTRKNVSWNMAE